MRKETLPVACRSALLTGVITTIGSEPRDNVFDPQTRADGPLRYRLNSHYAKSSRSPYLCSLRTVAIGVLAVSGGFANLGRAAENRPPNLLYIMADDLGYGDVGPFGQKRIRTPNV